jgi:hypothetical protein
LTGCAQAHPVLDKRNANIYNAMKKRTKSEVFNDFIQGEPDMQLREKYYIQCFDKKVFEKVSDAQKHVKNQQKYYKTKSRIYQCKICGNYHITTKFK